MVRHQLFGKVRAAGNIQSGIPRLERSCRPRRAGGPEERGSSGGAAARRVGGAEPPAGGGDVVAPALTPWPRRATQSAAPARTRARGTSVPSANAPATTRRPAPVRGRANPPLSPARRPSTFAGSRPKPHRRGLGSPTSTACEGQACAAAGAALRPRSAPASADASTVEAVSQWVRQGVEDQPAGLGRRRPGRTAHAGAPRAPDVETPEARNAPRQAQGHQSRRPPRV